MRNLNIGIVAIAFLLPVAWAELRIDNPIRGWRVSNGSTDVLQEVNYPASSVNMNRSRDSGQEIRGSIRNHPKLDEPLTLVVNGLDMPVRSGGDSFARPYAFGKGSNSVEVRDGKNRHAVQFYETNASLTPVRLRVLLSWDSDGTDLDLHVVSPDGEHCFYGNRRLVSGAALDVDVTDGYGPEIISMPSPKKGTYLVYVNYYGSGSKAKDLTTAKVTIVTQAGTPDEKIESSLVPMRAPGDLMLVKSFKYP